MNTYLMIPSVRNDLRNKLIQLFIFSAAMALLESAVVVYLRALYYPEGFSVALKLIDDAILFTEILREAATVVMLGAIAWVAGKTFVQRFSYFLFCFAVWDIFYYLWLKVLINWPESLFTWDILFLIPVTWLGPVLAPVLCSFTMILLAWSLLFLEKRNPVLSLNGFDWMRLSLGSLLILFTFMKDYGTIILTNGWFFEMDQLMHNPDFIYITSNYIPESYDWSLFTLGESILLFAIYLFWKKNYSLNLNLNKEYERAI